MGRYADAVEVYEEGLKIDPTNEQYKDAMANAIKVGFKPDSAFFHVLTSGSRVNVKYDINELKIKAIYQTLFDRKSCY